MIRRLFTAASVVSLLLCVSTVVLWVRSWSHPASLSFTYHQERCRAWIKSGRAGIDNEPEVAIETANRDRDLRAMEIIVGRDLMAPPPSHVPARWSRSSALPLPWLAIALAGVVVLFFIIRWARRARLINLQCAACGYNLTGNASGVCPECGTAITSTSV